MRTFLALALLLAACSSSATAPKNDTPPVDAQPLKPLSEATSAEFKAAFDAASDVPRYIVALSPT